MLQAFRTALHWLLITLVGAILMLMVVQVVLRYGFNASLLWAEEMCRYMLIWMSFLAAVFAFERGEVASLTFLSDALPRVPALLLGSLCAALSLALCMLLVWYGWIYAELAGQASIPAFRFIFEDIFGSDAPQAPGIFWVYLALPVGMAFIALRLISDLAHCAAAIGRGGTLREVIGRSQAEPIE